MSAIVRMLPFAFLLLGTLGCAGANRTKWVGKWQGEQTDLVSDSVAERDPLIAASLRQVTLDIRDDGTFELVRAGFPYTGEALLEKDRAILQVKSVLGQPIDRTATTVAKSNANLEVTWSPDGSIRLRDPADFGRQPVTLNRVRNP